MNRLANTGLGVLRRLAARRRLLPLTALTLRARLVHPSSAFVLREVLRRRVVRVYRLRGGERRVAIRHGTGDVVTLGEIFHDRQYEPPRELRHLLDDVRVVLDLGANIGLFGIFAVDRWPRAEIVGFEPDPENADVHERVISLNGLGRRWQLRRAAAGTSDSTSRFVVGGVALTHELAVGERPGVETAATGWRVAEVEVEDVLPLIAECSMLKMDIEGGEWAILADPRFRAAPPRVLVLEYHPRFAPGADPRSCVEAALGAAGMRTHSIWHRADGHGMIWAWGA